VNSGIDWVGLLGLKGKGGLVKDKVDGVIGLVEEIGVKLG
jgi:hypothetical protein